MVPPSPNRRNPDSRVRQPIIRKNSRTKGGDNVTIPTVPLVNTDDLLLEPPALNEIMPPSVSSSEHATSANPEPAVVLPVRDHSVCDLSMIEKITKLMAYGQNERNFTF